MKTVLLLAVAFGLMACVPPPPTPMEMQEAEIDNVLDHAFDGVNTDELRILEE